MALPANFSEASDRILRESRSVDGHLTDREVRFLTLLGVVACAEGEILEIGSFKGRSTTVLAQAAALAGSPGIVAVDPLTGPSQSDRNIYDTDSVRDEFWANLESAGVSSDVEFHEKLSAELAPEWNRKIRLLWIDGDHSYKGAKLDFDLFSPHLTDGAFVAFHDVLTAFEGGIRVFMEDVLLSPDFGPAGFCGSIAWAQRVCDASVAAAHSKAKLALYKKLSRLVPYVAFDRQPTGIDKILYKLFRSRVPHDEVSPKDWIVGVSRSP